MQHMQKGKQSFIYNKGLKQMKQHGMNNNQMSYGPGMKQAGEFQVATVTTYSSTTIKNKHKPGSIPYQGY